MPGRTRSAVMTKPASLELLVCVHSQPPSREGTLCPIDLRLAVCMRESLLVQATNTAAGSLFEEIFCCLFERQKSYWEMFVFNSLLQIMPTNDRISQDCVVCREISYGNHFGAWVCRSEDFVEEMFQGMRSLLPPHYRHVDGVHLQEWRELPGG